MKHTLRLTVLLATAMAMPAVLTVPALAQGGTANVYKEKCEMCHGADGKATTPVAKMMHVPSFEESSTKKASDAKLEAVIENGKNRMPAFKGQLSKKQIKQLVAYIRKLDK